MQLTVVPQSPKSFLCRWVLELGPCDGGLGFVMEFRMQLTVFWASWAAKTQWVASLIFELQSPGPFFLNGSSSWGPVTVVRALQWSSGCN